MINFNVSCVVVAFFNKTLIAHLQCTLTCSSTAFLIFTFSNFLQQHSKMSYVCMCSTSEIDYGISGWVKGTRLLTHSTNTPILFLITIIIMILMLILVEEHQSMTLLWKGKALSIVNVVYNVVYVQVRFVLCYHNCEVFKNSHSYLSPCSVHYNTSNTRHKVPHSKKTL